LNTHVDHIASTILCALLLLNCSRSKDEGPSPALTPEQELETFVLPPGMKIQLVAAEPMVQDPVVTTFDEHGRLWVVEMRGFMPDIDGTGERNPVGRIMVLEDTNSDGQMDVSTIYLDSLIMPRAVAVIRGGALIAENESLWLTEDADGNLKADTKILLDSAYAGSTLPEHSGNGLWRGVDNWYYNVKSRFRYRLDKGKWQRDSTEFRGQWGLSHDDQGRLFYNYNWSQLHADLVPPNYLSRNKNHTPTTGIDHGVTLDRRVYPIHATPAVNRGYIPGTLDQEGRLREFTAACSPFVYRGTALPQEYYGNAFVCEPSGNLVKRNVAREGEVLLRAFDPTPGKEFLASTDERFRPVHISSGPDGALYVIDMYRGLIQHGAYVTPYLRDQTLKRKLALPVNRGRIWRIVPEDWQPANLKKLSDASSAELITYLSHPNGWHRDMAQKLLVERADTSMNRSLRDVVLHGKNNLGRFHALWVMDGLHLNDADFLFRVTADKDVTVSNSALRLLEPFAKNDRVIQKKLGERLAEMNGQTSMKQDLQLALTSGILDPTTSHKILLRISTQYDTSALMRDAVMSSLYNQEYLFLQKLLSSKEWQQHTPAKEIFLEMLTTAIVRKAEASELKNILDILGVPAKSFGWKEKAMLTAMSIQGSNGKFKPIKLPSAPMVLKRTDLKGDSARLEGLSRMFEWPGHSVKDLPAKKYVLSEKEQQQFAQGRQHYLTTCAGCHGTDGMGVKRFAPTLAGSEWVVGDEKRLALLVLHGIEGPIQVNGKTYDVPEILPVMPSHSTMDDGSITSILTYIRNEWGNHAGPMSSRIVGATRHTSQGRVVPWTAKELNQYIIDTKDIKPK
jgi:mono/diheme cytochrome c family protein/glucose/arabinose dehydrogenase